MTNKDDPANVLMTVISALSPLAEADRQWVLQSATSRWTSTVSPQKMSGTIAGVRSLQESEAGGLHSDPNAEAQSAISKNDPRAFIRIKRPVYDVQRVACLGYFHMKTTGHRGFSSKGILKLHTDSGGSKINLPRALDNATRQSKYLSNRNLREKQLTTLGEDVVEALPDQDTVAKVEEAAKHPRRISRKIKKT